MKPSRMNPTLVHPASAAPEMVRIPVAVAAFGLSRSSLYREAARGNIVMKKHGRSTLVCAQSVRAFVASLPRASIRLPRGTGAAAQSSPQN
jgi:hypothetical protein